METGDGFELLVERRADESAGGRSGQAAYERVKVPAGPALLAGDDAGGTLRGVVADDDGAALVVEPVRFDGQPRLAMWSGPGGWVRVNGERVPRLALLNDGDQVELADGRVLHVTRFRVPQIGPPDAGIIGMECPFCRVKFATGTRVYQCCCGVFLHIEDPAVAGENALRCAAEAQQCPSCRQPIVTVGGYTYQPEGFTHG